jgi:hypothetical protein
MLIYCMLYALYDYYADIMILCVYLDSTIVCAMLYTIVSIWGPGNRGTGGNRGTWDPRNLEIHGGPGNIIVHGKLINV